MLKLQKASDRKKGDVLAFYIFGILLTKTADTSERLAQKTSSSPICCCLLSHNYFWAFLFK